MPANVELSGCIALAIVVATVLAQGVTASALSASATRYAVVTIVLLVGLAMPVAGVPLIAHIRGVFGDPSVPTVLVALMASAQRIGGMRVTQQRDQRALAAVAIALGVLVYPFALGIGAFDPYRLGFGVWWAVIIVLTIALLAIVTRRPLTAVALSAAVLAWGIGIYASNNLIDYLFDPLLVVWGLDIVITSRKRAIVNAKRPNSRL